MQKNNTSAPKRVLGIDPGLRHTGWAVVDMNLGKIAYVASGVINTNAKEPMALRLTQIHNELSVIMDKYHPLSAGLEETYVNKNYASSLKLAHARGVAMVAVNAHGVDVVEYSPKTVKKTVVGNGSAPKDQVSRMLTMILPGVTIKSEDESDSLAIAICHALHVITKLY